MEISILTKDNLKHGANKMTEINKDLATSILTMFNKVKTFNDMTPAEAIMFNKAVMELSKIAFPDGVGDQKKEVPPKPRKAVKKRATKKAAKKRSVP